jgi:sulfide:quinone oxidoreductase
MSVHNCCWATMGKVILILGAGFGGLSAANLLRKRLPPEHKIIVIDKKNYFMMGLVNLWILNGSRSLHDSKIPLNRLKDKGIEFLNDEIIKIDVSQKTVITKLNHEIDYDYLIIALGAESAVDRINQLMENAKDIGFNLYEAEEVTKLRQELLTLRKGRIAICITDIPYKCPPAPYEASLIIDDLLLLNRTRQFIDIDVFSPTPIALPVAGPKISQDVVNLLNTHNINFHPLHKLKRVLEEKKMEFENGKVIDFDNLVFIPPHKIPSVVKNSPGLTKEGQNWIRVDKFTLRTSHEDVYGIGDVTEIKVNENITLPKAGIFAETEAKIVSLQIINEITKVHEEQTLKFDGRGFCFMETGHSKAGFIDADFYNEAGPITNLESPSEESYRKKVEFEQARMNDWLG